MAPSSASKTGALTTTAPATTTRMLYSTLAGLSPTSFRNDSEVVMAAADPPDGRPAGLPAKREHRRSRRKSRGSSGAERKAVLRVSARISSPTSNPGAALGRDTFLHRETSRRPARRWAPAMHSRRLGDNAGSSRQGLRSEGRCRGAAGSCSFIRSDFREVDCTSSMLPRASFEAQSSQGLGRSLKIEC